MYYNTLAFWKRESIRFKMKKSDIKPRYLGKNDEGIKYYYAPADASYYKYVDGKFVLIPKYDEYFDEDLKCLGFKEPVISKDLAIAKALEYSSEIQRVKKAKKVKLKVVYGALVLSTLLVGGSVQYTNAEANKPLSMLSEDTFEDFKDELRSVIADNDSLEEQEKEDIYFYVVRYLETMDPTTNDIKSIEHNIKEYVSRNEDRIEQMGIIFNCDNESSTYDLLEYLETCEPIGKYYVSYE